MKSEITTFVETNIVLGNHCLESGRLVEACAHYKTALEISEDCVKAHHNVAIVLNKMGHYDDAIKHSLKVIKIDPSHVGAYCNLGNIYRNLGVFDRACFYYNETLRVDPSYWEAYHNLGVLYAEQDNLQEASSLFEKALRIYPDSALTQYSQGWIMYELGRIEDSIAHYEKSMLLNPSNEKLQSNYLLALNYSLKHDNKTVSDIHKQWGKKYNTNLKPNNKKRWNKTPKIGYMSPDFRLHPVAFFIEPILKNHSFETVCYAEVKRPNSVTERLKGYVSLWRNTCTMTDNELAEQIRQDKIDILIDLAGHTGDNRLLAFKDKPAPIQITYLGYPNTTGLPSIDYRITDKWADPPETTDHYYSEKLIRTPGNFFCYQPISENIEISEPPVIKNGYTTFGAFQHAAKINDEVIRLWAKVLKSVPDSRMIIQSKPFSNPMTTKRLSDIFTRCGIDPTRIRFNGYKQLNEYFEMHNQVDIILDTFPWNGHTTSCHALWMGTPLVTYTGRTHAGRLGTSILSGLGFADWVADNPNSYLNQAIRWANDRKFLVNAKKSLRQYMIDSELCNSQAFTERLENIYMMIGNDIHQT